MDTDHDSSAPSSGTDDAENLFDMWRDFRVLLERSGVSAPTIELARHGFYCGAMALLLLMIDIGNEEARDLTRAAERIEALRLALHGFPLDIRQQPQ